MTLTAEQKEALSDEVRRSLLNEVIDEPKFWANWILDQMSQDSMIEYLDLGNRGEAEVGQAIERLGFDPRENDPVTVGWSEPDADWPIEDWQREVAEGDTRLGYEDWVKHNKETSNEP